MPLTETVVDGQPGHAILHTEERTAVNLAQSTADSAKAAATAAQTTADGKYTKPATGIPEADLDSATRAKLTAAGLANVRWLEWKGEPALIRPTSDPNVLYVWIKRDPALPDPPIDATHILQNVDILLRAS